MADINVVPKRRSNLWIWIAVAIVVLLVALWLFNRGGSAQTSTQVPPTSRLVVVAADMNADLATSPS